MLYAITAFGGLPYWAAKPTKARTLTRGRLRAGSLTLYDKYNCSRKVAAGIMSGLVMSLAGTPYLLPLNRLRRLPYRAAGITTPSHPHGAWFPRGGTYNGGYCFIEPMIFMFTHSGVCSHGGVMACTLILVLTVPVGLFFILLQRGTHPHRVSPMM